MTPVTEADPPAVTAALARAAVYRALSLGFAYPTPLRLAELARAGATPEVLARVPARVAEALADLAGAAAVADPDAVAAEYVFLFDRQVRCPPWEGAWQAGPQTAGKGALLADLGGFYAAFGLRPEAGQREAEDHVVAELEFMAVLCLKEAWALAAEGGAGQEVTREGQRAFLADHLGRWATAFAGALGSASPLPYYRAAATLLAAWVAHEAGTFGVSPEPASPTPADPDQEGPVSCPFDEAVQGPSGPPP